jgi:hypothetical protein
MKKKYVCIAKVGHDKIVKYRLSDLMSFTKFLDENWSDWRWFNVYDKESREQLASFTRHNKPTAKHL